MDESERRWESVLANREPYNPPSAFTAAGTSSPAEPHQLAPQPLAPHQAGGLPPPPAESLQVAQRRRLGAAFKAVGLKETGIVFNDSGGLSLESRGRAANTPEAVYHRARRQQAYETIYASICGDMYEANDTAAIDTARSQLAAMERDYRQQLLLTGGQAAAAKSVAKTVKAAAQAANKAATAAGAAAMAAFASSGRPPPQPPRSATAVAAAPAPATPGHTAGAGAGVGDGTSHAVSGVGVSSSPLLSRQ
jgi:hypothetical protein